MSKIALKPPEIKCFIVCGHRRVFSGVFALQWGLKCVDFRGFHALFVASSSRRVSCVTVNDARVSTANCYGKQTRLFVTNSCGNVRIGCHACWKVATFFCLFTILFDVNIFGVIEVDCTVKVVVYQQLITHFEGITLLTSYSTYFLLSKRCGKW